ncbi:signal recognition particle-docking protein FtsY [Tissierella carlieri]|uniref:Signal recognition particle receptor FtsY n=1 Tax=Tissierella carlieri TaxID=689904 RepID=A0ABT1S5S3_9FIRM|nr:signal recognition particle-docking protein FtsY [Tissierella carlieri]MBU5314202.1 signal recognition particle-docking protein FtsY [Tissierella carlieri]MCQ4921818.1 signal recognition particle-docking protein FtsY [Tissierella carlieri]
MFKWFKKLGKKNEELNEDEKIIETNEEEFLEEKIEELIEEEIDQLEEQEEIIEDMEESVEETIKDFETELVEESLEFEEHESKDEEIIEENLEELCIDVEDEIENFQQSLPEEAEEEKPSKKKPGFFEKLMNGLTKTRDDISNKIDGILKSYKKIDEELFDDLEEVLVTADVGVNTTMELIDRLRTRVKEEKVTEPEEVKELVKDEIKKLMLESVSDNELKTEPSPALILVVGVNGVGKTTTIGKLSNNYKKQGKRVLIAAGDTFRAAAIEQLEEWGNRAGVEVIAHSEGADPAAVIYDGIQAAKARKTDILICDTAGRLHNKSNLMNELNKIFRVAEREYGDATKEVLLVLDATTGQNAINQAKVFKEVANITGVALTKLDGTAKGGVIIALQAELKIPVKLVGVGEGIEDLQPFIVEDFVEAIFD